MPSGGPSTAEMGESHEKNDNADNSWIRRSDGKRRFGAGQPSTGGLAAARRKQQRYCDSPFAMRPRPIQDVSHQL